MKWGRYVLLKLEQRLGSLRQKNSGLVKLSCFLFLLCHLHLWFAQHSPFRWCDLYFGHITAEVLLQEGLSVTSATML